MSHGHVGPVLELLPDGHGAGHGDGDGPHDGNKGQHGADAHRAPVRVHDQLRKEVALTHMTSVGDSPQKKAKRMIGCVISSVLGGKRVRSYEDVICALSLAAVEGDGGDGEGGDEDGDALQHGRHRARQRVLAKLQEKSEVVKWVSNSMYFSRQLPSSFLHAIQKFFPYMHIISSSGAPQVRNLIQI